MQTRGSGLSGMTPGAHILSDANLEQGILGDLPTDIRDNCYQILGAVGLLIDWQLDECMDRLLFKSSDPGVPGSLCVFPLPQPQLNTSCSPVSILDPNPARLSSKFLPTRAIAQTCSNTSTYLLSSCSSATFPRSPCLVMLNLDASDRLNFCPLQPRPLLLWL
jgi:hypothetical protein